ncbi:MAG: type II toxin-antitoxin system VapC family toxin [Ardenticatenaceae bacterium]|nr:type II toxin-antitoxin system VapC family toxin [Ardenticatenaceae bacterium]
MSTILLDTSALLYWTVAPDRLTDKATQALEQAEVILLSAISIWEIGIKMKRGKLALPVTIEAYANRLETVNRVDILSVDVATWRQNLALNWDHRDPADRTIVATAMINQVPLVTSDREIREFYPDIIW